MVHDDVVNTGKRAKLEYKAAVAEMMTRQGEGFLTVWNIKGSSWYLFASAADVAATISLIPTVKLLVCTPHTESVAAVGLCMGELNGLCAKEDGWYQADQDDVLSVVRRVIGVHSSTEYIS
jgi:hypothetical protein